MKNRRRFFKTLQPFWMPQKPAKSTPFLPRKWCPFSSQKGAATGTKKMHQNDTQTFAKTPQN